jgi:hypothetical protein
MSRAHVRRRWVVSHDSKHTKKTREGDKNRVEFNSARSEPSSIVSLTPHARGRRDNSTAHDRCKVRRNSLPMMICATMEASALPGREAAIASGSNTLNARPNYHSCDPCWRWPNDWRENHAYTLVQALCFAFPLSLSSESAVGSGKPALVRTRTVSLCAAQRLQFMCAN